MTLPSSTTSTAGSVTLEPTSPASVSTVRTSSTAAFSCLPPQRTIAYTKLSLSPLRPMAPTRICGPFEEGLTSFVPKSWEPCPGFVLRWPFRLSDAGRRRCLGWGLPVTACGVRTCHAVRRARFPGGRTAAAPAPQRLRRSRVGWLVRVHAVAGLPRGIPRADAGQGGALGGRFAVRRWRLAFRGGTCLSVPCLRVAHLGDAGLGGGLAFGRLVRGRGGGVRANRVRGGGVRASRVRGGGVRASRVRGGGVRPRRVRRGGVRSSSARGAEL